MKGLTLTQPWATLIALGEKRIETRSWSTNYRGPVAIHAAKGLAEPVCNEDGLRYFVDSHPFGEALGRHGITVAEQLPRAAVLATAHLLACLPTARLGTLMRELPELADFEPAEHERAFGNYEPGRYAWLFTDLSVFSEPIPYRGAQGLWEVPEDHLMPFHQPERTNHA
jgi:hypothetical protein